MGEIYKCECTHALTETCENLLLLLLKAGKAFVCLFFLFTHFRSVIKLAFMCVLMVVKHDDKFIFNQLRTADKQR